tara:strand:+ start:836 stop:1060 length:225 start_codon:yes stop_codon:yes gene_type:complete
MIEKIEAFLDEMAELSRTDPKRVIEIMRGLAGILIMAEMMKSEITLEANLRREDDDEMMAKINHFFRDDDELPN